MGTSKNSNGLIRSSAIIAAVGVIVGTTGCQPKKTTEMNSCSCACRQETESTVTIANKNFYSDAACGSFEGASCSVKVTTSTGSYNVSGRWEGCQSHGKANVRVLVTPDEIPTIVVAPDNVLTPGASRP